MTPTRARPASRASPTSPTRWPWPRSWPSSGLDDVTVAAALLHDAVEDTGVTLERPHRADFGPDVAAIVDGVTKLDRLKFDSKEAQQAATDAQDAGGHGQGPAGPDHQAVRPAPQHAHDRRHAGVEAGAHRPGDARHLRPAGPPPRHAGHEAAARGPLLRRAAPQALRRDRPHGRHPVARAGALPDPGARGGARAAGGAAHRRRRHRPAEAPLEHLREDGRQGQGVRRHLRPGRHPGRRRLGEGLLRRARVDPRHLEAGAGPVQGLRGHAQVQPLPVAAHHGGRAAGQAARGADPHRGDAQPGRARRGRPLALQGRRHRRPPTWPG